MQVEDLPVDRVLLSVAGAPKARAELTGFVQIGDQKKRIHILTMYESSWGGSYVKEATKIKKAIEVKGLCKREAIAMRDKAYS